MVLNNKGPVSEATRQRVLKAIKELNYHPYRFARVLATRRTGNVGFILSEKHFNRAEPFYTRIFLGTEFEARNFDYYVLLTSIRSTFRRSDLPRFLKERNVDGVIIAGRINDEWIRYIKGREIPLVLIDYVPENLRVPCVLIDNVEGGYEAVRYLLRLGHRRIGFLGGSPGHPSIQGRLEGYRKALAEQGIPLREEWVITDLPETTIEDGYRGMQRLFGAKDLPTALFAANDAMAIGAMKAIKEAGYTIPEDFSIIGFDDIEWSYHTDPPLTTMRVMKEEMGALALRRLIEIVEGRNPLEEKVLVGVRLIERRSCRLLSSGET